MENKSKKTIVRDYNIFEISQNDHDSRIDCFDKYGNYAFPTDFSTEKPNKAYTSFISKI